MSKRNFDPKSIQPGQKGWGYVNIIDTVAVTFDMPVMIINGKQPGRTFTVTAGLYPLEYCGVEAAGRLYQRIDPQHLRGTLVIIPVVNMPVFQFRTPMFALTQSLSPMDGLDITKVFPGNLSGSVTEVLAYRLFHNYILGSDYHVDLRGGELLESHLMHTIFLQGMGELDETLLQMGTKFGMRYCLSSRDDISHTQPGTLVYEAIKQGIPSIISESGLGYNTQPGEEQVAGHVDGVINLLRYFGMLPGEVALPTEQFYLKPDRIRVLAPVPGIFKHIYDQGEFVQANERIGTITDLAGELLSEIIAPCDAIVHEMMPRRLVYTGDRVYSLAVLDRPVPTP